ncbi:probable WRKY transcription factor 50 [Dendrobium catenatum]|uniref:Putative WRKY transcription factor 50 n=1 Tax=Dendrobium catenatum TaxID=906689 RepID=A0A2I0X6S6_9ASPA|nr:probable WRKY transcription factor 50 [Dendrobium catenatum]PKU83613.1 putative WRKY transcription factor 50 [Dendrobium catenatum]
MAALLEPAEMNSHFSSLQPAKLLHSSCEGSLAATGGGGGSGDVFDFAQIDQSQFFDGSCLTEVAGELETPTSRMMESSDLYEHEMEYEELKRRKAEGGCRIGFRTKSEVEILDDGFKWRKYGKKAVKNSPNPRNYYRCSSPGCEVKKRVERDRSDSSYVITIYEGTHNHISPDCKPYTTNPPQLAIAPSHSWSQQF